MHSGTPEIEPFFQIRKKLSIPVMQDLMPSFAIDIFDPLGHAKMKNCHTWPVQIQLPVQPAPQLAKHWLEAAPPPISLLSAKLHSTTSQSVTWPARVTQMSTKSSQQVCTNLGHLCQTLGISSNFVWLMK